MACRLRAQVRLLLRILNDAAKFFDIKILYETGASPSCFFYTLLILFDVCLRNNKRHIPFLPFSLHLFNVEFSNVSRLIRVVLQ